MCAIFRPGPPSGLFLAPFSPNFSQCIFQLSAIPFFLPRMPRCRVVILFLFFNLLGLSSDLPRFLVLFSPKTRYSPFCFVIFLLTFLCSVSFIACLPFFSVLGSFFPKEISRTPHPLSWILPFAQFALSFFVPLMPL